VRRDEYLRMGKIAFDVLPMQQNRNAAVFYACKQTFVYDKAILLSLLMF